MNTTSSAVNCLPSNHFTFSLRWNVQIFPSGEYSQDLANLGSISVVKGFICVSPSKRKSVIIVVEVSFAITGLKDLGSDILSRTKEPPYVGVSDPFRTGIFSFLGHPRRKINDIINIKYLMVSNLQDIINIDVRFNKWNFIDSSELFLTFLSPWDIFSLSL